MVKSLPASTRDTGYMGSILGQEEPLEKEMATHSTILAWKILWTEALGRLQFMESQRVRHHSACTHTDVLNTGRKLLRGPFSVAESIECYLLNLDG